ncbi:MAG TPA: Ppx/GppA phosphatase family protein [Roseateles sp.]|nr:Ppx/GppA phosphatase family protein [Roseateles sp.]
MFDLMPSGPSTLAAIDLGSNSFRLEAGHVWQGRYQRQHCRKEMVSLGTGLDAQGLLSGDAADRGVRCLRNFSAELAKIQPSRIRVVATQTLREARNRDEFLRRAEAVLGLPVEVISGHEEARLIYAGVAFLHPSTRRRLVVDIGGRSTEVIVGQARTPDRVESFRVGSASLSQEFFSGGRMTAARFRAARHAVGVELGAAAAHFASAQWEEAMGASGAAGMLSAVLRANGVTDGVLTPAGLRWLLRRCLEAGRIDRLDLPGLKPGRRGLLPGGLAILHALTAQCEIGALHPAKGALRQGVIIDLHERRLGEATMPEPPQEPMVRALQQRFRVDPAQSRQVAAAAQNFHRQLQPQASAQGRRELGTAAALHELGRVVSHRQHHRHGAYLLEHAGMVGLGADERRRLAALVLGQRGGLGKVAPALRDIDFAEQVLCLRLAVICCHERAPERTPPQLRLRRSGSRVCLAVPAPWADRHPQTVELFREEAGQWSKTGVLDLSLGCEAH